MTKLPLDPTRLALAALAAAVSVLAGSDTPQPAYAASMVVTTPFDLVGNDGVCSLRKAITNANDNFATYPDCPAGSVFGVDTITFGFDGTISLVASSSPLPNIMNTSPGGIIIDGAGRNVVLHGANRHRLFTVDAGAILTLRNLTVTQGRSPAGASTDGGAFYNSGTLNITDSSVTHSSASGDGGAVYNVGTTTIARSTFRANTAGAYGGAVAHDLGSTTISNSTFADNQAGSGGGAVYAVSGFTMYNSTVSGNAAFLDGGGGLYGRGTLYNTIVAGNTASSGPDCRSTSPFTAGPSNIMQIQSNCTFADPGNPPLAVDPLLGPLANNGGPTRTHALLGGTANATMTWSAPIGGADSYLLQVIPLDGSPITNLPLGSGVITTTQPVTAAGTCFQLVAFKGAGFGTTNVLCGVPGVGTLGRRSLKAAGEALADAGAQVAAAAAGVRASLAGAAATP